MFPIVILESVVLFLSVSVVHLFAPLFIVLFVYWFLCSFIVKNTLFTCSSYTISFRFPIVFFVTLFFKCSCCRIHSCFVFLFVPSFGLLFIMSSVWSFIPPVGHSLARSFSYFLLGGGIIATTIVFAVL